MTSSAAYGVSIGGAHATTIASQTARFGTLPVVRQFFSGMPGAVPAGLTTSMVWEVSFKCNATDYTGLVAGTYTTALVAWLRSLPAGQKVKACYYHEPENDGFTLAQWKAAAGFWNNLVHTTTGIVANVEAIQIYMVGTILGWNGRNINNYWDNTWDANHKPDRIGFDFDGPIVTVTGPSYPDMSGAISSCQAFAASKGIPWDVPEFGGDPLNSDSTHAARAAWNTKTANQFAAGGAQYVTYWDDGTAYLSQTNEINAWKTLVQTAPSTTPAAPTGITCIPAANGLTATIGWAAIPAGVDHLDAYVQGPGQTFPHKINTSPIPVTPRTYTFATVPGTTYDPGVTLVASADSAGTIRSGYGSFVVVAAPNPGTGGQDPIITSAVPAQDATNPLLYHLTAAATSPASRTLSYLWTFTYAADPTVVPVTLATASGDVTLPLLGTWNWTLAVTDTASLVTRQSGSVGRPLTDSTRTAFLNLRMLQHAEDVRQMAFIDQDAKPKTDAAVQALYFRKSAHNAKYALAGSSFNPDDMAGSTTLQLSAGNIYWGAFILEDIQLTQLLFASLTTAQSGTGVMVSVHDSTLAMVPEFGGSPVSADTVFQGAAGLLTLPLGLQVQRQNWGDLLFWQMSIPASGVTAAALRVGTGPGAIAKMGLVPLFGSAPFTSIQDPIPVASQVSQNQIWVGAR